MELRDLSSEARGFLSAVAAAGETFAYLATLEERVWVGDCHPEPATLEELRGARRSTREELVALGHYFGKIQSHCPVNMRSYFDWLLRRSHDAAVDPPCNALQNPAIRIRECRCISALLTKLADDPVAQLSSPPKQYGDFLFKRLEEYNAKQSEWPTGEESNGSQLRYTDRRPAYYSLPIPDPALEREVERTLTEYAGPANRGEHFTTKTAVGLSEEFSTAGAYSSSAPQHAHSDDFRSVRWNGQLFAFTDKQSKVVEVLWRNWNQGTPDVADGTLLSAADPQCPPDRLNSLFRDHLAWNLMIVPGGTKGTHRIAD